MGDRLIKVGVLIGLLCAQGCTVSSNAPPPRLASRDVMAAAVPAGSNPEQDPAADWPQLRGPNRDGISAETGINKNWTQKPPAELWRVSLSDGGYAGPSVAGGKVFIIDHRGKQDIVRALDLGNGEGLWQYAYADAQRADHGFSRATPTIAGGRLYAVGRQGIVNCLDAASGELIWTRDLVREFRGKLPRHHYSMSALVHRGQVIVCPGGPNAAVAALDPGTGATIWQGGGSDEPGYATPVAATILGRSQYVVFTGVSVIGVADDTGELLWRYPWPTEYGINAADPIVIGDQVFITSDYGMGCALLRITGGGPVVSWENKEMCAHFSTPVLWRGYLYGTGDPDSLMCLDPRTGKALWKQRGFERGAVIVIDGLLIAACGRTGDIVMIGPSPTGYLEIGRFRPLGGQTWTPLVVAHGRLIVRNKSALACYDLR